MSWTVQLLTTKGDKVADGFKVCLDAGALFVRPALEAGGWKAISDSKEVGR